MGIERPLLLEFPEAWTSPRVIVRPWRDTDAQPFFDAIQESSAHISQWLPWPTYHRTVDDTREFIRRQQARLIVREGIDGLGIFHAESGAILGGTGLHVHDWHLPSFEIGYWIRSTAEGKGYVSEAARLLTTFAFEHLHAERVMIRCDARNDRSKRVPERLGFTFEGCQRHDSLGTDGAVRDTLIYAMIPAEYARAKQAWAA